MRFHRLSSTAAGGLIVCSLLALPAAAETTVVTWTWTLNPSGSFSDNVDLVAHGPLGQIRVESRSFTGSFVIGHDFTEPGGDWVRQTPLPSTVSLSISAGWSGSLLNQTVTKAPQDYSSAASVQMDAWDLSRGGPPFATSYPGYRVSGLGGGALSFLSGNSEVVDVADGSSTLVKGLISGAVFYGDNLGNDSATVEVHALMSIYGQLSDPAVAITYTRPDPLPDIPEPATGLMMLGGLGLALRRARARC